MIEEKRKWHLYYLYPEAKIMPAESGGERIFMKKMMLTISLCSEICDMTVQTPCQ